jgi:hypothetical protein
LQTLSAAQIARAAYDERRRRSRPETLAHLGQRDRRVLDDVVEQGGGEHLLVVAAAGQQSRDAHRMRDERPAVLAALPAVGSLGERVGAAHEALLRSVERAHTPVVGTSRASTKTGWTFVLGHRLCVHSGRAGGARDEHRAMFDAALFALLVGAVATPLSWWGISRFG